MDALCRVCIDIALKSTPLNSKIEDSSSLSFLDFLNKCTSLNANESDSLPQRLCSVCANNMQTFYAFVKLAEKSNKTLREALKNSIATRKCNDNREISCGEITTTKEKIDASEDSTRSPLYIEKEGKQRKSTNQGPRRSKSKSIVHFKDAEVNNREKFNHNVDHPEGHIGKPVSCIDRRPASIDAAPSDNLGPPILDRIPITNETVEEESEDSNRDASFRCKTSKSSNGSSLYTLDIVKEEPRISEGRSTVSFKDAKINDRIKFHYNRDHPKGSSEGSEDILSYIDRRLANNDADHSDSDEDVPIGLLKRILDESNDDEADCSVKEVRIPSKVKKKTDEIEPIKEDPADFRSIFDSVGLACEICNRVFKTMAGYKNHVDLGHNGKTFKCKLCGTICSHKEEFRIHCLNYKIENQYEFNICEKDFARRKNCSQHLLPKEKDKQYICPICGKGFNHISNRWTHLKTHGDKKPECEICGKLFSTKQYLNVHMENHKGLTKKCHMCGRVLKNSVTLQRHLKWHNNIKPFKCECCGKSFSTKYMYTHHMTICISNRTMQEARSNLYVQTL